MLVNKMVFLSPRALNGSNINEIKETITSALKSRLEKTLPYDSKSKNYESAWFECTNTKSISLNTKNIEFTETEFLFESMPIKDSVKEEIRKCYKLVDIAIQYTVYRLGDTSYLIAEVFKAESLDHMQGQ